MSISIPNFNSNRHVWPPFICQNREPESVHGQLEGCNRNVQPKAAVTNNNNLTPNLVLNIVCLYVRFGDKSTFQKFFKYML